MIDKEVYHKIVKEVDSCDSPLGINQKNTHITIIKKLI